LKFDFERGLCKMQIKRNACISYYVDYNGGDAYSEAKKKSMSLLLPLSTGRHLQRRVRP
jgi:hypothetical protein